MNPAQASVIKPIDKHGAWCPHCHNRASWKDTDYGFFFILLVLLTMGVALLLIPILPKTWHCTQCNHQWKA
jgi:hypothetical protein